MSNIDKTIKDIRPSLRLAAPQTYWFTVGFGVFNILLGVAVFNTVALYALDLVNVIPVKMWGVIFAIHGIAMIGSLFINEWKITKALHYAGVAIKTAWWIALLSYAVSGHSPALLFIWSLLLYMQIIVIIYFTPRFKRA